MLFVVPLLAAAALVVVGLADIPWSSVSQTGAVHTLRPVAVQVGLILLALVAVGGSAAAIAAAIGRSELDERMLRFALLPAGVATVALALGLLAAVALNGLIYREAPQVGLGSIVARRALRSSSSALTRRSKVARSPTGRNRQPRSKMLISTRIPLRLRLPLAIADRLVSARSRTGRCQDAV